jgi:magnesium-protoporphyrin IX monomethyl ester (oxidative) cyclase
MRMKILLLQPYITGDNPYSILTEPMGLACLDAYLQDEFDVAILDLFILDWRRLKRLGALYRRGLDDPGDILRLIREQQPDVVGLTCNFTSYASDAYDVARLIREHLPALPIVIGGAHATMDAQGVLAANPAIDYVVRGEGEVTCKELLRALRDQRAVADIAGISYRKADGTLAHNPKRPLLRDIRELPIPSRKKLQMERYLESNREALYFTKTLPVASIMTSRGCPYNCIFCSTKVVWERHWRPRSPEQTLAEIEALIRDYGIREFAIIDDQFIGDRERVRRICELIIEKKLNITLSIPSGASVWLADEALLRTMQQAGFYRLCFPVETGNETTLKFIRKPVNLAKAKATIQLANRLGFWTQGNFIIGFPYETREEIEETIRFAYRSGLDYVFFCVAKPYAGSDMYEIFRAEGLLESVTRGSTIYSANYDTKTLKAGELQRIRNRASRNFLFYRLGTYLNPVYFWRYLRPKLTAPGGVSYAAKIFWRIAKHAALGK